VQRPEARVPNTLIDVLQLTQACFFQRCRQ
jgi:hypothetical protein